MPSEIRPNSNQPSNHKLIAGIILIGLLLRLTAVILFRPPTVSDDQDYQQLACSIVKGNGFVLEGKPTAYRPPGYPLFMAGVYTIFGFSKYSVRIFQVLIDMISCLLLYLICKKSFSNQTALLSAAIFAVFPIQIFYTCELMTETFFAFILILMVWVVLNKSNTIKHDFILGILMGIAILVRPTAALLPIVIFIYRWKIGCTFSKNFRGIFVICLTTLIIISPWLLRNYHQFNRLSITSNTGVNFWMGTHTGASGSYSFPKGNNPLEEVTDEFKRSDLGMKLGLEFIISHSFDYSIVLVKKFAHFFSNDYWLLMTLQPLPGWKTWPNASTVFNNISVWLSLAIHLPFVIVLLFGIFGLLCNAVRHNNEIFLFRSIILYWLIIHLLFYAGARYRFPIVPFIMIAAAYSWYIWKEKLFQLGKIRLILVSLFVILFIGGWIAEVATIRMKAVPLKPSSEFNSSHNPRIFRE